MVPSDRACAHPTFQRKLYGWRLNGYSGRNMKCVITTCTRKTTNWYFKTLDFKRTIEKVRGKKSTGNKYGKKKTKKQTNGKTNTGNLKKRREIGLCMRAPKGTPLGSRVLLYYYYSKETSVHAHAITSGSAQGRFQSNMRNGQIPFDPPHTLLCPCPYTTVVLIINNTEVLGCPGYFLSSQAIGSPFM